MNFSIIVSTLSYEIKVKVKVGSSLEKDQNTKMQESRAW